ncbi:CU044_2847 family protein [Thiohalocapsa sp. ML1]|uniref:CU044_2847 family protein n=1 Tax=Thiohalocapsa sp. ML1 TaxID=1431688 RepID=UPI00073220E8|nr:CU044_2847 family protein [Thiohalocapsa sp. ML1]
MAKLIELDLGDGRTVLVEIDDEVSVPRSAIGAPGYARSGREGAWRADLGQVQQTLRGFVDGAVAALQETNAEIELVTLAFGVSLGGEAGVPFITRGDAAGTLKITVQCNLSRRNQRLALDPKA